MREVRKSICLALSCLLILFAAAIAAPAAPQTASNEHRPVFFPDGDTIVFMSDRADGDWELYRSRLDGGEMQRLTWHPGWDGYADVSPDGRSLIFDRSDDAGHGIVLLDLESGAERWLVHTAEDYFLGGGRFAPDGESVIYASEEPGSRRVYRMWLADRRVEPLAGLPAGATDAIFSPDGRSVAAAVWRESGSAVQVTDLATGTTRTVIDSSGHLYGMSWSSDGQRLFFNDDADGDQEIYVVGLDGGTPRRLTDNGVSDHLPTAAPSGNRIIFTSERDGAEHVYLMDVDSGATVRVGIGTLPVEDLRATTLAFVNVQVVSVVNGTVLRDAVAVVQNGRIEEVGRRYEVAVPLDVPRIDGRGGYLLPGLIDAHVHMRSVNTLRLYLARGFTTVRDMNGNLSQTLAARDLVRHGELLGSRVVAASPTMLAEPFNDYPAPQSADEAAALPSRFRAQGYDLIKVFRVRHDAFVGLMEAARAEGLAVAGHVPDISIDEPGSADAVPFDEVLASGMSSLEHIVEVAFAGTGGMDQLDRLDDVARQVAQSRVPVTTLAANALTNNELKLDRAGWLAMHRERIAALTGAAGLDAAEEVDASGWEPVPRATVLRIIETFHRAGVALAVGTDSHHPVALAGDSGLDEIELLAAAGLSPLEALRAATTTAAEVIGRQDEIGRIAPGMAADLLLLSDNPLDDLGSLRAPVGVMAAGRWLDRDRLELLVQAAVADGLW